MKYEDFFREKPKAIAPVYVFVCEDSVRAEEGAAWLMREAARLWSETPETVWIGAPQSGSGTEGGGDVEEEGEAPASGGASASVLARLEEAAGGGSLFGGSRFVWTRRIPSVTKPVAAFLARWEKSPAPKTAIGVWAARKPLQPVGTTVEFARLYGTPPAWKPGAAAWDTPLAQWIARRARVKHGRTLAQEDAQLLVERVGEDLDLLAREVETLALYTEGRDRIARADIEALVSDRTSAGVNALASAIARGDRHQAFAAVDGYFTQGMAFGREGDSVAPDQVAIPLVAGLAQFALDCARAREAGAATPEALRAIGVTSMTRQEAVRAALRRSPAVPIGRWFGLLADLDRQLKTEGSLAATSRARLELALADMLGGGAA